MKSMIFAAGLGTRLKPITDTLPKALVQVGGKPLIEHVTRKLRASGIEEAVVNVHHFADEIERWIDSQDWICSDSHDMSAGKFMMHVSDERELLLETGGGILKARRFLEGCGRFLIHNVDVLSNLDISRFESEVQEDALATLLVSERETSRYLLFDPDTMRLVGWTNVNTGEVRSPYPDLDVNACRKLAFSGIHILSDVVFNQMDEYVNEKGLQDESCSPRFPIIDFYLWVCARRPVHGVISNDLKLVDVGKLDTLELAEKFIQENS